jgi:hypothetical protein
MPILRLLGEHAFGPDEITILVTAFEQARRDLGLIDREDPATLIVAERIIALAKQGERDIARLREAAVMSPPR